ncbi:hypothetical protein Vretimale_11539 [Volvox reticuliferus]|nr:hypothetical protein Vretimale_11539 [Volvox reticuliferus]
MVLDAFQQRKAVALSELQADCGDKSRKGSVDAPVADLVARINTHPAVYTTSSCSGRITVFGEPTTESRAGGKKGGEWVYASHDPADPQEVISAIHARCVSGDRLVFRFEPFILALEANSAAMGQRVLGAARAAGFRESGLTLGSGGKRVMVGVRCSLRLEVPVADAGIVLVPDAYLTYLVGLANDKFQQNLDRIRRFEQELFLVLGEPSTSPLSLSVGAAITRDEKANAVPPVRRQRYAVGTDPSVIAPPIAANGDAGRVQATAALPRRRRADSLADGRVAVSEPALKALKLRQVRVLGRIRALEIRLARGRGLSGGAGARAQVGVLCDAGSTTAATAAAPTACPSARAVSCAADRSGCLRWRPVVPVCLGQAGVDEAVPRWGHASAVHDHCIYLLGGYGGGGAHSRRSDVLVYDTRRRTWEALDVEGTAPPPRMGHTAAGIGDGYVVLIGGRTSPVDALADVWILDLEARSWIQLQPSVDSNTTSGALGSHSSFPGRYRHSAVSVPPLNAVATGTAGSHPPAAASAASGRRHSLNGWRVVVFGGRNADAVLDDTWVLSRDPWVSVSASLASGWRWQQVAPAGGSDVPSPRKSHAACWVPGAAAARPAAAAAAGRMYVHGGTCGYGLHFDDTFYLDLTSYVWHRCEPRHDSGGSVNGGTAAAVRPPACFSHTLSRWGPLLLLVGGYPTDHHRQLHVFDTRSHAWATLDTVAETETTVAAAVPPAGSGGATATAPPPSPPDFVPIRHCAEVLDDTLYVMGGGAFCFSFGTLFGGCFELRLAGAGPLQAALLTAHEAAERPFQQEQPPPPPPPPRPNKRCQRDGEGSNSSSSSQSTQGAAEESQDAATAAVSKVHTPAVGALPHPADASASSSSSSASGIAASASPTTAIATAAVTVTAPTATITAPTTAVTVTAPTATVPKSRIKADVKDNAEAAAGGREGGGGDGHSPQSAPAPGWVISVPSREAKAVKDALKAAGMLDMHRRGGVVAAAPSAAVGDSGGGEDISNDGDDVARALPSRDRVAQWVLLPITDGAVAVAAAAAQTPAAGVGGAGPHLAAVLQRTKAQLLRAHLPSSTKAPISPAQRLRDSVAALLRFTTAIPTTATETETETAASAATLSNVPATLVSELLADLPSRWERLGDLVLLPAGSLAHPGWVTAMAAVAAGGADVLLPLWRAVAEALGVKRLARQAAVANTGTRDSRAVLLLGSDGWVAHREGSVTFHLDVTRCMFSSGNVTERTRMGWGRGLISAARGPAAPPPPPPASATATTAAAAAAAARAAVSGGQPGWAAGETVVDLYSGIGYYTLPLLVVAGVAKVYACEWNPHALEALRRNLQQPPLPAAAAALSAALSATGVAAKAAAAAAAAPVSSRCEVLAGDCRLGAPVGVADRVLLGLLPSSRGGWEVAIRALRPDTGGWLHLHHNVTDSEEAQWLNDTMDELRRLAVAAGRDWQLRLHHVERVKWYAPRIRHIVMDIECRPVATATSSDGRSGSATPNTNTNIITGASPPGVNTANDSTATATASATGTGGIATDIAQPHTNAPSPALANGPAGPRWYEQPYDVLPRVRRV